MIRHVRSQATRLLDVGSHTGRGGVIVKKLVRQCLDSRLGNAVRHLSPRPARASILVGVLPVEIDH
jgi:hypothetical protein